MKTEIESILSSIINCCEYVQMMCKCYDNTTLYFHILLFFKRELSQWIFANFGED